MVKLDASFLRYLSQDDFRVLTAVEVGLRNHELVPATLVSSISSLGTGISKVLHNLTRHKLLVYERGKKFDGYRLTYLGYDYLALNVLSRRGVITKVGNQIGVGKESDVFCASNDDGDLFAIKLHRLGRICFRKVNDKRDYHHKGRKLHSWIYMSRLAALREFAFMKALHDRGFPTPRPVDNNRHAVVMQLIEGTILNNLGPDQIGDPAVLYDKLINLLLTLANEFGLVHGDFNEFNIMIENETLNPILIDFPQMISTSHKLAETYFKRDVECIVDIFKKRFRHTVDEIPVFEKDVTIEEKGPDKSFVKDTALYSKMEACRKYVEDLRLGEYEPVDENDIDVIVGAAEGKDSETETASGSSDEVIGDQAESSNQLSAPSEGSVGTVGTFSVANSTFSCEFIRAKLRKESANRQRREELHRALKNVKGEDCAVRRQRRQNADRIKEDLDFIKLDGV